MPAFGGDGRVRHPLSSDGRPSARGRDAARAAPRLLA